MKPFFKLLLGIIATFISVPQVNAQSIIIGQVGENDIYSNPEPDPMIQAVAVHLTIHPGGSFSIDVDQNGTMDFTISASAGGGLGGGGGGASIQSLSPQTKILTHPETSVGYPGDAYYTVNVADTLNFGQTIDNSLVFDKTGASLWSTNYGYASGAYVYTWNSNEDHYIGFIMRPNVDTLYGWIRLIVNSPGISCLIILKDFACNINEFASINAHRINNISVFPNPATDYLNISSGSNEVKTKLNIYNSIGTKVDEFIFEKELIIDISDYSPGIYYLKFGNNAEVKMIVVY